MDTNHLIIDFVSNNYILLVLIILFIVKIIPPEWAGFWKYNNNNEADGLAPKISPLKLILNNIVDGTFSGVLIPLIAMFEFKKIITLVIFIVVVFNVIIKAEVSGEAITLISIGIIALYLEKLIETGKKIKIFGGLLHWEKNEE